MSVSVPLEGYIIFQLYEWPFPGTVDTLIFQTQGCSSAPVSCVWQAGGLLLLLNWCEQPSGIWSQITAEGEKIGRLQHPRMSKMRDPEQAASAQHLLAALGFLPRH